LSGDDLSGGAADYIAYQPGAIYFRGLGGNGPEFFVEKIACP
jgi:hypothetical protein